MPIHKLINEEYLQSLKQGITEKSEICSYLDCIDHGNLVEIGPGPAEALVDIVNKCQKRDIHCIIIDLETEMLIKARKKMCALFPSGVMDRISFIKANVADSLPFEDNSVAAINISSVLHECFSYYGGIEAVNQFIREASRSLKENGLLIYRDPDGIDLHKISKIVLTTALSKNFFHFFIGKFLDHQFSQFRKTSLGYAKSLKIECDSHTYNLDDFLNLSLQYEKDITIEAKNGLIKEFERHFILFCKDVLGASDPSQISAIDDKENNFLSETISIDIGDPDAINEIRQICDRCGFNYQVKETKFIIHPQILNILYSDILKITEKYNIEIKLPTNIVKALDWGIREGEENYFYGSAEEIIARFALFSVSKNNNEYTCLCPLSVEHSKTHNRPDHAIFLKNHIRKEEESFDRKRSIHFTKMPLKKALPILSDIYKAAKTPYLYDVLSALEGLK
jgi:ubiquinone/menaquinone biosynthesis C-methylase UbiE